VSGLLDSILNVGPWTVIVVVGVLVFAEDAIFVGFVLPGETVAILGGVAASRGHVPLVAILATVVIAAILGDSVGYEVGKQFGPRLLNLPVLHRRRQRLDAARNSLARRGGTAVFLGRFTAFFRAVMPALAGISHMPYRRFLVWNVAGGLVWGCTVVVLGFAAGNSYAAVAHSLGRGAALVALGAALIAVLIWHVRRRRHERSSPAEITQGPDQLC
jgi:membrane-associated protein